MSGRGLPVPGEPEAWWLGEMMFLRKREVPPPLVSELAGDEVPVPGPQDHLGDAASIDRHGRRRPCASG